MRQTGRRRRQPLKGRDEVSQCRLPSPSFLVVDDGSRRRLVVAIVVSCRRWGLVPSLSLPPIVSHAPRDVQVLMSLALSCNVECKMRDTTEPSYFIKYRLIRLSWCFFPSPSLSQMSSVNRVAAGPELEWFSMVSVCGGVNCR